MITSLRGKIFSEKEFWKIIEMMDWHFVGEDENVVKRATAYLSKKSESFIKKFHQMLLQKLRKLQGCQDYFQEERSGESFLFTRCAVIAAGKKYYESVVSNPNKIRENTEFNILTKLCNGAMALKVGENPVTYSSFKYYSAATNIHLG